MTPIIRGVVAALAVLVAAPSAMAQTLRYGGEPGQAYTYTRQQTDHVTQTVQGTENQTEVSSFWRYDTTLESADGGTVTYTVVHDTIAISTTPSTGPTPDFSSIYGEPITVRMTRRGDIQSVDVPEDLPESAARLNLQTTYQNMFPRLPEDEVSTGSSWADTVSITTNQNGLDIQVEAVRSYTVGETVDRGGRSGLQIDYMTDMTIEGAGAQQGTEISLTGTGTGDGVFWITAGEGVLLGSEETSEMNMEAFVSAQGQNLVIPIVQNRTEEITLVE